jgi:hypothetical protein
MQQDEAKSIVATDTKDEREASSRIDPHLNW